MLDTAMLTTMFDYNAVTNARLLDCAAKVSDEQLDTPTNYSVGSLRQTLWHTLIVEYGWGGFCRGTEVSRDRPPITPTDTIASFQAFQTQESAQMRAYLDGVSSDALTETLTRKRPDGTERSFIRWQILAHILYHSAQHRSEAAELLTRYGQSPGDTDFIYYVAQ